jgi:transcriptional regulator with XRE-family HTH domain
MDKAAADKLKQLYEKRVPKGMSQAQFGETFGIGTQGLVSQYLNGHTALTVEAAAKFAKGLGCKIDDISPEMARRLRQDIVPVLAKVSLKAALALLIAIPPSLPSKAEAAFNNNLVSAMSGYTLALIRRLRLRLASLIMIS